MGRAGKSQAPRAAVREGEPSPKAKAKPRAQPPPHLKQIPVDYILKFIRVMMFAPTQGLFHLAWSIVHARLTRLGDMIYDRLVFARPNPPLREDVK